MVMGDIAVPTSQQHMTAGFMLVTTEDVVLASTVKFFLVDTGLCLMKIMFALAVLCSNGPVPWFVAADDFKADHADDIALLVE